MKRDGRDLFKGVVSGMMAGLAGAWVMNQFQAGWSRLAESLAKSSDDPREPETQNQSQPAEEQVPATVKAASAVSRHVFSHELTDTEKQLAGPATHYGFGAAMGGVYGAIAELTPRATAAAGIPFGAALWFAADEIGVPALGLGKPPSKTPVPEHLSALATHLVYGLTTELARWGLRRIWRTA